MGFGKSLKRIISKPSGVLGGIMSNIPGLEALGGGFSAYSEQQATREQNMLQREAADRQMAFQERLSSTARQREMADLKAAGLNPILAAGGSGASSPAGAMPDIERVSSIGEAMTSSAREQKMARLEREKVKTETDVNKATKDKINQEAFKIGQEAGIASAKKQIEQNKAKLSNIHTELKKKYYPTVYEDLGKVINRVVTGAGKVIYMIGGDKISKPVDYKLDKKSTIEWMRRK